MSLVIIYENFRYNSREYKGDIKDSKYVSSLELGFNEAIQVGYLRNNKWHEINIVWCEDNHGHSIN